MKQKSVIIIGFLGLIITILFMGNNIRELQNKKIIIYFPIAEDFPNPDFGKMTLEFRFPATKFKVGDDTADILMFLDSGTIPKLKLYYSQKDEKIYAGIPLLTTEKVSLLDGETHKLEYEFNREQRKQSIFLDDNLLATGEFTGELNAFSSYVIYEQSKYVESQAPIKVSFE